MSALNSPTSSWRSSAVSSVSSFDAARVLLPLEHFLERIGLQLVLGLHAEHDVAVHLDEAAIRVPREALVLGVGDQALHRLVVEAEVQDRVHHAGHRGPRARAHGDEQRRARVAELPADQALDARQMVRDLLLQLGRVGAAVVVVVAADVGRDREARRHGQPHARHLGEVGALAAEEVLHLGAPVGASASEGVDIFLGAAGRAGRPAARLSGRAPRGGTRRRRLLRGALRALLRRALATGALGHGNRLRSDLGRAVRAFVLVQSALATTPARPLVTRARSSSTRRSTGMRTCCIESRSRTVTVSSLSVSWSTVMPNGVPISSCRR